MPPRKEPKEQVQYPASKRKPPPFKPLRPSKLARTDSNVSSSSGRTTTTRERHAVKAVALSNDAQRSIAISDSEDDIHEAADFDALTNDISDDEDKQADMTTRKADTTRAHTGHAPPTNDDDDEEDILSTNPLNNVPAAPAPKTVQPQVTTKPAQSKPASRPPRLPAQAHAKNPALLPPSINQRLPRDLLVRLLHENFTRPSTKIDEQAVAIIDRYLEIFVCEALARAKADRVAEVGNDNRDDEGGEVEWLGKADLERVAAGLVLDF